MDGVKMRSEKISGIRTFVKMDEAHEEFPYSKKAPARLCFCWRFGLVCFAFFFSCEGRRNLQ